jgi:hypothetical protein
MNLPLTNLKVVYVLLCMKSYTKLVTIMGSNTCIGQKKVGKIGAIVVKQRFGLKRKSLYMAHPIANIVAVSMLENIIKKVCK